MDCDTPVEYGRFCKSEREYLGQGQDAETCYYHSKRRQDLIGPPEDYMDSVVPPENDWETVQARMKREGRKVAA